ncbi:MAG: DUF1553/DUF1549/Concanavalin A-like lectin/glucanases superfamily protein/Planctomycete cytochrome C [Verrucomicrobia bacterium]|nr:MAG: DUF1553/DUF1549/Concanavalin A-like lectin/glucanases superfamily protein/Planctomycete cytochrome C [Verrucomicrobiota bacterium]
MEFNRDIRPILSDKCFGCHGPDSGQRKAGLRLDLRDAALKPAKSGDVPLTPGNPAASQLLARVLSSDKDEVMPPPEAKMERLTKTETETLRRWISEGAEYQALWSFIPPKPASLATGVNPSGIDHLIQASLSKRGLTQRPEARPEALLRRASLDLTGLPPSAAEVRAYLADPLPGAYERAIDRLLQSPSYGERWTADWLDLARYADSFGFQVDRDRSVWPWRDWVVDAFNRNLPFNDFVTWQLAGDLLPNPSEEQILATAFNRLHQQEAEGGSVEEEYRVEYISDRVQTFGTAFLGLTFECAKCHDHKFDPISQKEFYQMFAFFDDIDEAGLYSFFTSDAPTPATRLLPSAAKTKLAALEAEAATAEKKLSQSRVSARDLFADWLGQRPPELLIPAEIGRFQAPKIGEKKLLNLTDPAKPAPLAGENIVVQGRLENTTAVRLSGDDELTLPTGSFNRSDPFSVSLWLQTPTLKERAVVLHRSKAWTDAASRGFELLIEDGKLKWSLVRFWPGDAASIKTKAQLQPATWNHVAITSDGSGKAGGLQIFVNGQKAECETLKDNLSRDINPARENITLGARMRDRGFKDGLVEDIRVFNGQLSALQILAVFDPKQARAVWSKQPNKLSKEEENELFDTFLAIAPPETHTAALETLRTQRSAVLQFLESQPEISVMKELPTPKKAYVLSRGQYDQRKEEVFAGTPSSLPPFPSNAPRNRLGLARWLTDPGHPLLARVSVNRFWQALFGRGLVRTSDDFGSQGAPPEYQDVLDGLALRFIQSGWNTKALLKEMVLSRTYRQESIAPPALLADDPENTLLARGPRFRLPAEAVRDTFLSASGLLSTKIGGPPVNPYEGSESFRPIAADKGDGTLRRSLYTRWRRTSPPPAMMAFDSARRAVCSARRERTNTPLQALVLLNGPQYVEAARVLGERLQKTHSGDLEALIEDAFLSCLSRFPDAREKGITTELYQEQLSHFQAHPQDAAAFLKTGQTPSDPSLPAPEVAAAAILAQCLLNHDGSIVKQ